jgi:3-oxoacyl-[acyl-carrier-protein] synthase-3
MTIRAVAIGIGHYLPDRIVPNSEFEKTLDTTDEWIRTRSGISNRHFAAEGQTTSQMATMAAKAAISDAGITVDDIDAIIVATSTPDLTFPSVGTMVQAQLGMTRGFAFDVQAVCAGFVFALTTANSMIQTGQANRILVIGADMFSKIMDWEDRSTCVLFGDGAGALLLEAQAGKGTNEDRGILSADLNSDGRHKDMLYVDGGVSSTQSTGHLRMQGNALFRRAVERLTETAHHSLGKIGLSDADIDWIVPHQANIRIIKGTAKKMGLSMDNVIVTLQDHGNTSAASIPLAMSIGHERGQIKQGDLLLTEAIGGGLAWGSVIIRW